MVMSLSHSVVRPAGPSLSPRGVAKAVRDAGALGFLESVRAEHSRLAYLRLGNEHTYLLLDADLIRTLVGEFERPAFGWGWPKDIASAVGDEAQRMSARWRHGAIVRMWDEMAGLALRTTLRSLPAERAMTWPESEALLAASLVETEPLLASSAGLAHGTDVSSRRVRTAHERLAAVVDTAPDTGLLSLLDARVSDTVVALLLRGARTTASVLTSAWTLLASDRDISVRLRREVDGLDRIPTAEDLADLPFTRAVIAETARLSPPAWLLSRRVAEPLTIDTYLVPAGAVLAASPWLLHRDERWWPDPTEFRPERWLTDDGHMLDAPPGPYSPFGTDSRGRPPERFTLAGLIWNEFPWTSSALALATLALEWIPELLEEPTGLVPSITLQPAEGTQMRLRYRR